MTSMAEDKGVAVSCGGREEKQQSSLLKGCGREGSQHALQASVGTEQTAEQPQPAPQDV